jgi:hypothetical protein
MTYSVRRNSFPRRLYPVLANETQTILADWLVRSASKKISDRRVEGYEKNSTRNKEEKKLWFGWVFYKTRLVGRLLVGPSPGQAFRPQIDNKSKRRGCR